MPKLRKFYIDEAYLCDVTIIREGNRYTDNGHEPTAEEMLKLLKGEGEWRIIGHEDHPEFKKLREELGRLGYIDIERSCINGDRVRKSFKLNGYIARKGWQFSCATALGCHFSFLRKYPKYDKGYLN